MGAARWQAEPAPGAEPQVVPPGTARLPAAHAGGPSGAAVRAAPRPPPPATASRPPLRRRRTAPAQAWPGPVEPIGPAPGVQFASHGARLVAYIVDGILIGVLVTAVAIALALLTAGLAAAGAGALAVLDDSSC